ncbi:hypothetical protein HYY72_05300 [Candidatus Woesearchaeota archaeon]|nr:hypothetical protein [Candidatus Woesearchaeota archaeon]
MEQTKLSKYKVKDLIERPEKVLEDTNPEEYRLLTNPLLSEHGIKKEFQSFKTNILLEKLLNDQYRTFLLSLFFLIVALVTLYFTIKK